MEQVKAQVAKRRAVVEENAAIKGQRLLLHLTFAMVSSLVFALVSVMGFKATQPTCITDPIEMRLWFSGMAVLQGMSCLIFFILHCSVADLLGRSVAQRTGSAAPESTLEAPTAAVVGHQSGSESGVQ